MSTNTGLAPSGAALRELGAAEYERLIPSLRALDMNTLFARAVLDHDAPGRVFVDSAESPSVAYVIHGYGMSLLFGGRGSPPADDRALMEVLGMRRSAAEWLQLWPEPWAARLAALSASSAVEQHTRVNFEFSPAAYHMRRRRSSETSHRIVRADRSVFSMTGSVVPRAFWTDVDRFLGAGAGFAVLIDDKPASLAFSSFVTSSQLEIGIETVEQHRGRGLATLACAALIDHCLARGLEPVWACRLDNGASHRLAETLGFVPVRHLPYFRLPPAPGHGGKQVGARTSS
jgi:RimJ/RimL family protein N-acetyltransferase